MRIRDLSGGAVRRLPVTFIAAVAALALLAGTGYAVSKLPKNSVGSAQIRSGQVKTSDLADGAVTAEKLAAGASLAGPRGPRGAEGPQGPQGPRGEAAPTPETDPWHELDYRNGWNDWGNDIERGSYRKEAGDIVRLRGLITRATGLPEVSVIAVLPPGYRPTRRRVIATLTQGTNQLSIGRLDIRTNGEVVWGSGNTSGESDFTSLENITFDLQ